MIELNERLDVFGKTDAGVKGTFGGAAVELWRETDAAGLASGGWIDWLSHVDRINNF